MEKSAKKKNIVLQVAQGMFARFGLIKTSVDDISRAARIGKSSIFYYFNNKENLYKEVLERESRILRNEIYTTIAGTASAREKLKGYILTTIRFTRELKNIYTVLTDRRLEHYYFIKKFRKDFDREETAIVKYILDYGVKEKAFVIKDLELTTYALCTAISGLEYSRPARNGGNSLEKQIDGLLDVIIYGIYKR
ncbi:MAG: TetR/AcrR family transcriptional regulator [Spirochaetia bacterium]|nr:TetR/AcrR family transcriptional regulator [Spirochaetia bacterium]